MIDLSFPSIALVGDFPSLTDLNQGQLFTGHVGSTLSRMMEEAGLRKDACYMTTVFSEPPPGNDILAWCVPKKAAQQSCPVPYNWPSIKGQGKYIPYDILHPNLTRLQTELIEQKVNLVIALGPVACWALLGSSNLTNVRGTVCASTLIPGQKVIPVIHPEAIIRIWSERPTTVMDFKKCTTECTFPEIRIPHRMILIDPTLDEIEEFIERCILPARGPLSVDIETEAGQITCIGFARSTNRALVIPFVDKRQPDYSYWRTPAEEVRAWRFVIFLLMSDIPKLFQNGMYDMQYIFRFLGAPTVAALEDTMLLHHALQPELEKSLRFLGSIYTTEASWKNMRKTAKVAEMEKADE